MRDSCRSSPRSKNVAVGAHLRGHASVLRAALHLERDEEGRLLAEASRRLDRVTADHIATGATRTVLSILRPAAAAKGLKLGLELGSLPTPLAGDRLRLQQALLNFVANAIKFTASGRVIDEFPVIVFAQLHSTVALGCT